MSNAKKGVRNGKETDTEVSVVPIQPRPRRSQGAVLALERLVQSAQDFERAVWSGEITPPNMTTNGK